MTEGTKKERDKKKRVFEGKAKIERNEEKKRNENILREEEGNCTTFCFTH